MTPDKSIEEIIKDEALEKYPIFKGFTIEGFPHEIYTGQKYKREGYIAGRSKSIEAEKQKDERIKELKEFVKELIPDPYPEDVFLPISKEELLSIHQMLEAKFNMPLDRLSGHIGRLLRNPLREKAKKLLNNK